MVFSLSYSKVRILKMKIWIITVNYGNTKVTNDFIKSLENCKSNKKLKLFIVDNNSAENTKKELNQIKNNTFLNVNLIFNKKNIFYWPAIKKAFLENKKKETLPDWIIACNNDIIFHEKNFFNKLRNINKNTFSIIGPAVLNKSKKDINPFMLNSLSIYEIFYWNIYFKSYKIAKILNFFNKFNIFRRNKSKSNYRYYDLKSVYAVHGSIIIFSNYYFKKGGYFDSNFKLFCEELTTAEIAKKIGCKIYHIPTLKVLHAEHSSTSKVDEKRLYRMAKESHNYFIKNYFS